MVWLTTPVVRREGRIRQNPDVVVLTASAGVIVVKCVHVNKQVSQGLNVIYSPFCASIPHIYEEESPDIKARIKRDASLSQVIATSEQWKRVSELI